jgi:hypothetical protein
MDLGEPKSKEGKRMAETKRWEQMSVDEKLEALRTDLQRLAKLGSFDITIDDFERRLRALSDGVSGIDNRVSEIEKNMKKA